MQQLSYSCRCALIADLLTKLKENGSWCGETHLQKAFFILQDITKSNFGYKFVLYKHGPYSFELNNELNAMLASDILELQVRKESYGPSYIVTPFGNRVLEMHRENIDRYLPVNKFIAEWFKSSDVRQLERVATAYYVTKKNPRDPATERAKKLNSLKPHVDIQLAEQAIRLVDEKRNEAKQQLHMAAA